MRDEHVRKFILLLKFEEKSEDLGLNRCIERACRFIEDDKSRLR